jgi:ubiquinone/menaquinone biosynthesis C-methylase UbiE
MNDPMSAVPAKSRHVCPWWCCFTFDNFLRKSFHDPRKIVGAYIKNGDTVVDVGPGMGYFTIPLATMVGESGTVIAADLQPQMLSRLRKRAVKAGVEKRIVFHQSRAGDLGLACRADFILAFWMVHEVLDQKMFLRQIKSILKPSGVFLLCEPVFHVSGSMFDATIEAAKEAGFIVTEMPDIFVSRAALLKVQSIV